MSYLVGTVNFPLQLHLILPLPQHLLAERRQAWSGVFQLEMATKWKIKSLGVSIKPIFVISNILHAFLSSGTRSDWNFLLGQSFGSSLLAISARWKLATCAEARCTLPLGVRSGLASLWAFRASSSSGFWGVWKERVEVLIKMQH